MDTIELEIVTPDRLLVREPVEQVQLPGKSGYLGILPGHAPLISELKSGELSYRQGGSEYYLAVSWGMAEVLPERVTVLADSAERPEEIDVARAEAAKAKAEEALQKATHDLDYDATLKALHRAEVRLQVAAHAGHTAAIAR